MTQIPIALQLYTVRDNADQDLAGTLTQIAEIGYANVELAGLYGQTSSHLKTLLENAGLNAVSAHVSLESLSGNAVGQTIADYLDLGVYTFVVPHVTTDVRQNGAGYLALAERLNAVGELLARYGSTLGYHNHEFELTETCDGIPGLEVLITNTDSSLVTYELDTYWALFAGYDPVEFIRRYSSRISLLHIKDMNAGDRSFAPVGTGVLPLDGIVEVALQSDVNYLIVEQDTTKGSSFDAIQTSMENLKSKGYA